MMREYQRPTASERVRLHLNENGAGASPRVLDALRTLGRREAGCYPDYDAAYAAVSACFAVPREYVVLTNGLDEGIFAASTFAFRDRRTVHAEAVGVSPAFDMYEICTRAVGGHFIAVPLDRGLALPFEAIRARVTAATRIVFLTNPHNPTGATVPVHDLCALARELAPVTVFVDEAYADFSGATLIDRSVLSDTPNLIVGRTFSKAYGLAGLRVGALVAAPATISRLREVLPPYSVNAWAAAALPAAIADTAYREWYVAQAAESRTLLAAVCARLGFETWPSTANFVLVDFGDRSHAIVRDLARRGIAVRHRSSDPGGGFVRVTAGLVEDTRLFVKALEEALCDARD